MRWSTVPCSVLAATLGFSVAACHKSSADDVMTSDATLTQRSTQGTLHWRVRSNGETELVVKDASGKVMTQGVTGQVNFVPESGVDPQVDLKAEADTGVLHADGPDLDGELTLMSYALLVDGKPWTGSLHLPKEGTKGLVASAAAQVSVEASGPHGGSVQVIEKQQYEVVADADTSQTRVYLVGPELKRPKRIKLALDAEHPELVELQWHADGYYVAELHVRRPRAMTLVVLDDDERAHVALVGYRPGAVVVVDAAPVFWVRRGWEPGLARGHYKGTPMGPPGQGGVIVVEHAGHEHDGHPVVIHEERHHEGKGGKVKFKGR